MPIHKAVDSGFFKKWSDDMAYVLGFFVADGSMVKTNRGTHFIEFQVADREIVEEIKKVLKSEHKISRRVYKNRNCVDSFRLQIGSKEMFLDLSGHGLTQAKSKIIRMPKVPKKYFGHFVRGYFDGDGCITSGVYKTKDRKNPRFTFASSFTSGSKMFLEDLQKELNLRGISGFINKKTAKGKISGYGLIFSHRSSLALYDLMYNNNCRSLYLERKKEKFDKIFEKMLW